MWYMCTDVYRDISYQETATWVVCTVIKMSSSIKITKRPVLLHLNLYPRLLYSACVLFPLRMLFHLDKGILKKSNLETVNWRKRNMCNTRVMAGLYLKSTGGESDQLNINGFNNSKCKMQTHEWVKTYSTYTNTYTISTLTFDQLCWAVYTLCRRTIWRN